jgi:hypothetical protein
MTTTTQGSEESSNTPAEPSSDSLEHWLKDIRTDLSNDPPDWAPGDTLDGVADHMEGEIVSVTDTFLAGGSEGRSDGLADAATERVVPGEGGVVVAAPFSGEGGAPVGPGPSDTEPMLAGPGRSSVDPVTGAVKQVVPATPEEAPPAPSKPRVGRHRAPDSDDA